MIEDEAVRETRRIKEEIADQYDGDVHKIAAAARRFAQSHPLATTKKRKMVEDYPPGHSVIEDDEALRELRQTRDQMLAEHGNDPQEFLQSFQGKTEATAGRTGRKKRVPASAVRKGLYKKTHRTMTNSANKLR